MTSYRFLNRDHSLVLRDDHVISWDAKTNRPLQRQPATSVPQIAAAEDEMTIWQEAGSPEPSDFIRPRTEPDIPRPPPTPDRPPWEEHRVLLMGAILHPGETESLAIAEDEIAKVEDALPTANDVAELREQVLTLTKIVHKMLGHRSVTE